MTEGESQPEVDRCSVQIRIRGPKEAKDSILQTDAKDTVVGCQGHTDAFQFSKVFQSAATNNEIFDTATPLIDSVLDGINASILAYGQTGSGKTHTLFGNSSDAGVVPLTLKRIIAAVHAREAGGTVSLCAFEIYNEVIRDLLAPGPTNLQVANDKHWGTKVVGATTTEVTSFQECMDQINKATASRTVACTAMNSQSSRSHCIVTLEVTLPLEGRIMRSKLSLVDLAGSERCRKTGAQGATFTEGQNINRSLLCLNNVVNALTDGKTHTPYRDSKLTRVLQDSLGGSARSMFIVCLSPNSADQQETLSSLRFAARACRIKRTPKDIKFSFAPGSADKSGAAVGGATKEEVHVLRHQVHHLHAGLTKEDLSQWVPMQPWVMGLMQWAGVMLFLVAMDVKIW